MPSEKFQTAYFNWQRSNIALIFDYRYLFLKFAIIAILVLTHARIAF